MAVKSINSAAQFVRRGCMEYENGRIMADAQSWKLTDQHGKPVKYHDLVPWSQTAIYTQASQMMTAISIINRDDTYIEEDDK